MITIKNLQRQVSFYARAGDVNTSPPIGPMLSQHGIDVKQFCTMFNNETKDYEKGILLKVILNIYKNNTFSYIIKNSPLFFLFELNSKNLLIESFNEKIISLYDIYLITLIKNSDLKNKNIKRLFKIILQEVKKNGYLVLEYFNTEYYYIYI